MLRSRDGVRAYTDPAYTPGLHTATQSWKQTSLWQEKEIQAFCTLANIGAKGRTVAPRKKEARKPASATSGL